MGDTWKALGAKRGPAGNVPMAMSERKRQQVPRDRQTLSGPVLFTQKERDTWVSIAHLCFLCSQPSRYRCGGCDTVWVYTVYCLMCISASWPAGRHLEACTLCGGSNIIWKDEYEWVERRRRAGVPNPLPEGCFFPIPIPNDAIEAHRIRSTFNDYSGQNLIRDIREGRLLQQRQPYLGDVEIDWDEKPPRVHCKRGHKWLPRHTVVYHYNEPKHWRLVEFLRERYELAVKHFSRINVEVPTPYDMDPDSWTPDDVRQGGGIALLFSDKDERELPERTTLP